jgi:hypothetical protein
VTYDDWKRALVTRAFAFSAAFFAGIVVEAMFRLDVFGVALVAFFVLLGGVGSVVLFEDSLERWYDRMRAERGGSSWDEY